MSKTGKTYRYSDSFKHELLSQIREDKLTVLEAGKELNQIILALTKSQKNEFIQALDQWYNKWRTFLLEKTYSEDCRKWHYTHKRLRSAYRRLITNLPYLFTYLDNPGLDIPNTTNSIEGCFSNLKTKLRVHSGIIFG